MSKTAKIFGILLLLLIVILIVSGFFFSKKLQEALANMESATKRLDTASMQIESSKSKINNIQQQLVAFNNYNDTLQNAVDNLDDRTQARDVQFIKDAKILGEGYTKQHDMLKKMLRSYWPAIQIIQVDTSRSI